MQFQVEIERVAYIGRLSSELKKEYKEFHVRWVVDQLKQVVVLFLVAK